MGKRWECKSASLIPRSKTSVHHYDGSNVDLGTAAGKLYRVGVMSIQDAGDSDLVSSSTSLVDRPTNPLASGRGRLSGRDACMYYLGIFLLHIMTDAPGRVVWILSCSRCSVVFVLSVSRCSRVLVASLQVEDCAVRHAGVSKYNCDPSPRYPHDPHFASCVQRRVQESRCGRVHRFELKDVHL